jgi:predicted metalloprotease with PDZ domain
VFKNQLRLLQAFFNRATGNKRCSGLVLALLLMNTLPVQAGHTHPSNRVETEYSLHHREKPFVLHGRYVNPGSPAFKNDIGIIGLRMFIENKQYPVIEEVYPGTPAAIGGILAGETVLSVNGVNTFAKSLPTVDRLLSGQPGDSMRFSVLSRSGQVRTVYLTIMALSALPEKLRMPFAI